MLGKGKICIGKHKTSHIQGQTDHQRRKGSSFKPRKIKGHTGEMSVIISSAAYETNSLPNLHQSAPLPKAYEMLIVLVFHYICMLHETKWNEFNLNCYFVVLPSYFDNNCVILNARGTSEGCLIGWRRNYQLLNSWSTKHTVIVVLTQMDSGQTLCVFNIYGHSNDRQKQGFW